ncbi:MAG: DNA modification methylase, partial [Spirochaetia bacterium]|nr:DNA modification methylase [Spirochaetia bacterium]
LDEKYCDVIVRRYIELTGSTAGVFVQRDGLDYTYEEVASEEATDG